MKKRIPAQCFPPREFIKDELAARKWTVKTLAKKSGIKINTVKEILSGEISLGPVTAAKLAYAFESSAVFWMNLQMTWEYWHDEQLRKEAGK